MRDTDRLQLLALLTEEIKPLLRQSDTNAQADNTEFITDAELTEFFRTSPNDLDALTKKQVALAKHLASGAKDSKNQNGETDLGLLVPIMARLEEADQEKRDQFGYPPAVLNPKDRNFIIPTKLTDAPTVDATKLWKDFADEFKKLGTSYAPEVHQTVFALLHKYTARIQAPTPHDPDVSFYDYLRTTAAIAACIAREGLSETDIDAQRNGNNSDRKLCMLLKGDLSGIQSFLYQILSDGAARQLRGRSFYLQLLTEAIAHWVLRTLGLPIVNLLLASGGHFYILSPYTDANEKLEELQRKISEKLWTFHQSELSFTLAATPVTTGDFNPEKFSGKWGEASIAVNTKKQKKWSEMEPEAMFEQLFKPTSGLRESGDDPWEFGDLGKQLRDSTHLIVEVEDAGSDTQHTWESTLKAFGWKVELDPPSASDAKSAVVYRLDRTDFLDNVPTATWSYDFKLLPQVIVYQADNKEAIADYGYIADASDGVDWLGALRMDIDDLGAIFMNALGKNATLSRMTTLSESIRLFFEGYVPELCRDYNAQHKRGRLELIYAGGDDLFLIGAWSALPEIAKKIRDEFRDFVTGDHVTLSGGIFIEHQKFPLYQFADRSGDAEHAAKELKRDNSCKEKDAISFLQKPMSWEDFDYVSKWHQTFLGALTTDRPLPHGMLTRLNQIYSPKELEGKRWAWRSLYYFSQLKDRYRTHHDFIEGLRRELNQASPACLKKFIGVVTRWTALKIRETQ